MGGVLLLPMHEMKNKAGYTAVDASSLIHSPPTALVTGNSPIVRMARWKISVFKHLPLRVSQPLPHPVTTTLYPVIPPTRHHPFILNNFPDA